MNKKCRSCEHQYRGKHGNIAGCIFGSTPEECQSYEVQKVCCFDCRYFHLEDKSCALGGTVPGIFRRHECSKFEFQEYK